MVSLLGGAILLGGCWDRTEINDIAIVTGLGIDRNEDGSIELAVQVFIPRALGSAGGMGGGASAGGQKMTLVRSGSGVNIADAASRLQGKLPRKMFWGHCKVFIFGEELAKRGIRDELDFLLRHPEPRERSYVYVSKGNAVDVLTLLPPLERYSSEVLREISDLQIGMRITSKDLIVMFKGEAETAVVPFIDKLPPEKGEKESQTIPYIKGTSIFKKNKMIGTIAERTTRGVMTIRNEITLATITVEPKNAKGSVSVNPVRQTTTLIPQIEDGIWSMRIRIETEGDLVQNETDLDPMNLTMLKELEQALEADIQHRVELALKKTQKELKADVLGFAAAYHRKYPKQWQKSKDRWEEIFPEVRVSTDISVCIRRPGLQTVPAGNSEEEATEK